MTFRIKAVLILIALLAGAPGSVAPASAASFSPLTCFVPSGVFVTTGGALKNGNTSTVTVTCPIDKGGNGPLAFTWWLGFDDTNGQQSKCTYRRFTTANPNVVESSGAAQLTLEFPTEIGKGWLSGKATASAEYYHDVKCLLAPDHSITALVY